MGRITGEPAPDIADKENWLPEDDEMEFKPCIRRIGEKESYYNGKIEEPKPTAVKPFLKCIPCNDRMFDTVKEFFEHAKACNSKKAPILPVPLQLDYGWLRTMHRQAVTALRMPTTSQKAFMNLWNDFSLDVEHMLVTAVWDPYKRLREFMIKNRQAIIDSHLGVEFLAHARWFHESGYITTAQCRELLETFTSGKFD